MARRDEGTFFYSTAQTEGGDYYPWGTVYRYDISTGQSFRITGRFFSRLMGGLSPDGKRLIYRSEPFNLNVLDLDDPETRACGVPVAAGKG